MMYRNGQRQYTITLSKKEMQALSRSVNTHLNYVDFGDNESRRASEVVGRHLHGPPDDMLDKLQEAIEEWACERGGGKFNSRDSTGFDFDGNGRIILTVNPDGDWDGDRMVDCTGVTATWLIDWQSVDFELDPSMEAAVLDEWREQDQYVRRGV